MIFTPRSTASFSASGVLPGPLKTIRSGGTPRRSASQSSKCEITSAVAPARWRISIAPGSGLVLYEKPTSTAGQAARKASRKWR